MYLDHFGLQQAPFKITPETKPTTILKPRLAFTHNGLKNAADDNFSIQLRLLDSRLQSDSYRFLKPLQSELHLHIIDDISIGGKFFYPVLYGNYVGRSQAIKPLQTLFARLKNKRPFLRPIRSIKAATLKTCQQGSL